MSTDFRDWNGCVVIPALILMWLIVGVIELLQWIARKGMKWKKFVTELFG